MKKYYLILVILGFLIMPFKNVFADTIPDVKGCHTISLSGTNVRCFGENNGSATLTINGGSGNFSITWSNGATDVYSISNLTAGYYDVKVLDNSTGCSAFSIINITEPDKLTSSITAENVKCYGEASGNIEMDVTGGTLPYTVNWSNSVTTLNNPNVPSGTYSVHISDGHTCETRDTIVVTQPAQALGATYSVTKVLCNNDANGAIDVSVWGGTAPYSYDWNGNTYNTQDLANISAGTYNLTITDHLDCFVNKTVQLANPTALQMSGTITDNKCYGKETGVVSLSVSGGTLPYNYDWSNSEYMLSYNTATIDSLPNETYYVTVTDSNGCFLTDSFEVTSPTQIMASTVVTDVSAFGGNDGMIDLTVSGGTPGYSFNWSNGASSEDLSNITAGTYTVIVFDTKFCSIEASAVVKEPLSALSSTFVVDNASCFGATDADIFAYVIGGTPPYRYLWSTGDTISYLSKIPAGTYTFKVTDKNNIEIIDTIIVAQPEPFSFTDSVISPSCFGFSDGKIILQPYGGTEPYKYAWYDSDFALAGLTKDLDSITIGDYTVNLIDTMGCTGTYSVSVDEPTKLNVSSDFQGVECAGGNSGEINIYVSGGVEPYQFVWSSGDTSQNLIDIPVGDYTVYVFDNHNCSDTIKTEIVEPDPISLQLFPTPVSCTYQSDGYITSTVSGGSGGYNYLWSNNETTADIDNLDEGEYSLTVTDIYDCAVSETTYVAKNEGLCVEIPNTFSPNGDNINDTWVIDDIFLFPECKMTVYNKWGRIVFASEGYTTSWDGTFNGNPLPSGTYYYILTLKNDIEPFKGTVTIVK